MVDHLEIAKQFLQTQLQKRDDIVGALLVGSERHTGTGWTEVSSNDFRRVMLRPVAARGIDNFVTYFSTPALFRSMRWMRGESASGSDRCSSLFASSSKVVRILFRARRIAESGRWLSTGQAHH